VKASDKADKAEAAAAKRIAAAFRLSVEKARSTVDRDVLVAAIARGDRVGALAMLQAALAVEGHGLVEAAWGHAAADAGRLAADEAPDLPVRKRLSFNFLAPSTFSILSRWASQLRRSLETIALRAVSLALDRGLTAQASPEAVADDMLASLGLTERQAQAVANYRAYLENLDRAGPPSSGGRRRCAHAGQGFRRSGSSRFPRDSSVAMRWSRGGTIGTTIGSAPRI
jgi:hypothetical protein